MDTTFELRKFVAPEFVFGMGARHLAGRYVRNFRAKKILLVTDSGIKKTPFVTDTIKSLQASGVDFEIFSDIPPNPRADNVMKGAEVFEKESCTALVAVGGGSVIDCAKGIGIVSSNYKYITEFEGVDRISVPPPPLVCIPTTAGSSADVSQFAIISDPTRKVKMALISKAMVPDIALIDPETLVTMAPDLTANTGLDVLTHAIEAYVSNASSPVTDIHALEAIRLITGFLPLAVRDPANLQYRGKTMLASLYAGLAFSNASLGAVHAMAHSIGGYLDFPHGKCNALLLDSVISYNYPAAPERYDAINLIMESVMEKTTGEGKTLTLCDRINDFRRLVGVCDTLGLMGVKKEDIPVLAEHAMRDACMVTNPRRPTQPEIEAIYEAAL
jgi:alcohol dehydrogenase class IV